MSATPFMPYDRERGRSAFVCAGQASWFGYLEFGVLGRLQTGNNCCMNRRIWV